MDVFSELPEKFELKFGVVVGSGTGVLSVPAAGCELAASRTTGAAWP